MKLSKNDFRKQIEDKLVSVPDGQRIFLPKEILDELLFDVIQFNDKSIPSMKVPVWSGEFLSKIDFDRKELEDLFENVSWSINCKSYFIDIFCGKNYEKLGKKMGDQYDELWDKENQHWHEERTTVYTNTNANIDFKKSWEYKMVGEVYISSCDFRGTDLSKCVYDQVEINKSNLKKTGIRLLPKEIFISHTNLEGVDLSDFEIDFIDITDNYMFEGCNLKDTGIRINNFSRKILDNAANVETEDIIEQFKNGEFDGCYINGKLMKSKEERQEIAQQMRIQYQQFRDDLMKATLSDIDDQINRMRK